MNQTEPTQTERPLRAAMLRGWRRRCPSCGSGPILRGYLSVRDTCPVCGEALHHQRADDGPAYLTILIVGHVLGPLLLWVFIAFRPDPLVLASIFSVGSVALSLFLLPRIKGALIGIQWSRRMHGFGNEPA
ncbi:MAG: DUF983 domain-containing protein [Rhodobacteraceae bacterium]|nr:DUF983 domain-containing protein [Paracoccaceae bacterium]